MTLTIEQVVSLIPSWQGRPVTVSPMTGGLTNTNFRVDVDGTPYFVRIPGAGTELLAVDRVSEIHNARAAGETGGAPARHLAGRGRRGGAPRAAARRQRLHAGPRFHQDFDMFRLIEFYLETAERYSVRIPDDYRGYLGTVARIEQAVQHRALPTVPCHNDLLAENYIDDGRQLWLIDFEYSGNNDPCFELGNTCQELQYGEAQVVELCSAYFGQATASLLARMRLFALMSDVGWTLWGAIQVRGSTLAYDFGGAAMGGWNRALRILNGPQLDEWLGQG